MFGFIIITGRDAERMQSLVRIASRLPHLDEIFIAAVGPGFIFDPAVKIGNSVQSFSGYMCVSRFS
jgi:hypothetical protein